MHIHLIHIGIYTHVHLYISTTHLTRRRMTGGFINSLSQVHSTWPQGIAINCFCKHNIDGAKHYCQLYLTIRSHGMTIVYDKCCSREIDKNLFSFHFKWDRHESNRDRNKWKKYIFDQKNLIERNEIQSSTIFL